VYIAEAGPTPHLPEDGRILSFEAGAPEARVVAAGAPLLVDVQLGRGPALYGLAQGEWDGQEPASPALPNTRSLGPAAAYGGFTVLAEELDRPTSLEIVGDTAYVVTLTGEVLKIDDLEGLPTEPEAPPASQSLSVGGGGSGTFGPGALSLLLMAMSGHLIASRRRPGRSIGYSLLGRIP